MRSKKGFLFTFITVFLLFSLLVLCYNYMQRNKQSQEFLAGLGHSGRINSVRENIVSDYFTLLDVELDEIKREDGNILLKFNNFSVFSENGTYQTYLDRQESFTEGLFANMTNVEIQLENFAPTFSFFPYNSTFVIGSVDDPDEFFIYINDYSRFNGMTIDINLNASISDLNSTSVPSNDSDSNPYLIVRVFDSGGSIILNKTGYFKSNQENGEFIVVFNKVVETYVFPTWTVEILQNVSFSYGKYRDVNPYGEDTKIFATFHLKATGIDADVGKLYLNYTQTTKKTVLMTEGEMYLR